MRKTILSSASIVGMVFISRRAPTIAFTPGPSKRSPFVRSSPRGRSAVSGGGKARASSRTRLKDVGESVEAAEDTSQPLQYSEKLSDELSSPILATDPATVEIIELCDSALPTSQPELCLPFHTPYPFVNMIRGSSPYIANHRKQLVVYHIPGDLLEWEGFADLMDDVALTWLFGMRIVIVVGCRHQIDHRMPKEHICPETHAGIRITDNDTLRLVEEEAGYVRFEVERQLNRCLRLHGAIYDSPGGPPLPDGNVVSGYFYSAHRFGEIDGVDYGETGYPTDIQKEKICQILKKKDVVLLTSLAFTTLGDALNVNSQNLAAFAASALGASKVIYFSSQGGNVLRNKVTKKTIQNFRLSDAQKILEHFGLEMGRTGFPFLKKSRTALADPGAMDFLLKIGWAAYALERGVDRAHIVSPTNGALLEELFTARDGGSTCISQDLYQAPHPHDTNQEHEITFGGVDSVSIHDRLDRNDSSKERSRHDDDTSHRTDVDDSML